MKKKSNNAVITGKYHTDSSFEKYLRVKVLHTLLEQREEILGYESYNGDTSSWLLCNMW